MGLAGPRKRAKLSHDPNNTCWARHTGRFGYKVMVSQGWTPGDYLGVKDAPHAEFHTAANASYIKIKVNDDNLGLGAKRAIDQAAGVCPSLDSFQRLLGRLNGKDEDELAKEQTLREDLRRVVYTEKRFGKIQFVNGGYLIGDKIRELVENETDKTPKITDSCSKRAVSSEKKDVRGQEPRGTPTSSVTEPEFRNRSGSPVDFSHFTWRGNEASVISNRGGLIPQNNSQNPPATPTKEKKRNDQKLVGRDRIKTKGKKKRKEKRATESLPSIAKNLNEKSGSSKQKSDSPSLKESAFQGQRQTLPASSPVAEKRSNSSLPGRHIARSRFIAQKRLAALDPVSLNEPDFYDE